MLRDDVVKFCFGEDGYVSVFEHEFATPILHSTARSKQRLETMWFIDYMTVLPSKV